MEGKAPTVAAGRTERGRKDYRRRDASSGDFHMGEMGPDAKSAVPSPRAALLDHESFVRDAAADALKKVDSARLVPVDLGLRRGCQAGQEQLLERAAEF